MTAFIQLLVLGMATGGFYTSSALGLVTVFRSSGVIHAADEPGRRPAGSRRHRLRNQRETELVQWEDS